MDGMQYGYQLSDEMITREERILCPSCGVQMPPNAANLCVNCIRSQVDITEGIPKQAVLYFCKGCDRYLSPPQAWILCQLESRELLAICLKRLKGLSKVRLVDAGFIWTEPHSKRVKVKLTIQKEVFAGAILQQIFVVEYVVQGQFCDDCHRREAQDTWKCLVQVRQKARHKKTFYYLEQLIIKHNAHAQCVRIKTRSDGIDFYFASKSNGKRIVDFLHGTVALRYKESERMVSQDIQNGTFNFKYTYSVEICTVCKDDIVCLPKKLAHHLGGITPLCIVTRMANIMFLVDPFTLQRAEVHSSVYWRNPFKSLCTYGMYTEYTVLDMEPVYDDHHNVVQFNKWLLVDLCVARVRDLGENDTIFYTRCHLGNILQVGDNVWGYDLTCANFNDENANLLDPAELPDVMLVKKSYSDKRKKRRRRNWKLKFLNAEEEALARKDGKDADAKERELEAFMQDLEEDVDYRSTVNIYHDQEVAPPVSEIDEDERQLQIGYDEMLEDFGNMDMQDGEQGPDAEDAAAFGGAAMGGEAYQDPNEPPTGLIGGPDFVQPGQMGGAFDGN